MATTSPLSLSSRIKLNNGHTMPRIHLGVYMTSGRETEAAVRWALQSGYRAVDSAEWYANENEVGTTIRSFLESDQNSQGLHKDDIWFTTKLKTNAGYDATRRAIKKSLKQSELEYLDLYLLHSPFGGAKRRLESWAAVQDAVEAGEIKSAGVSNFGVQHLQELLDSDPRIVPAVNQVEVHPFNTRTDITSFCRQEGIVVQAYAPLARALRMKHPRIVELSKKYSCTPAQLMIRWSLQHGYVPLPKSVTKARIVENGKVEGFEIDEADMKALDGLDEYLVTDWDPTDAD